MRHRYLLVLATLTFANLACASAQNGDPPTRVGRVSDLQGNVSLYPVGAKEWSVASLNYPLTSGDALWADAAARGEVELGPSTLRLGPGTSLVFGEVSDSVTQIRLDAGSIYVSILDLAATDIYEIDTPAGSVSLLDRGQYRVDVTPDGLRATVTVRSGSAETIGGNRSYPVSAGSSATLLGASQQPALGAAVAMDAWEQWAASRDRDAYASESARRVPPGTVGYEDLDNYGTWQDDPTYGSVWMPRNVAADWAPYRDGRWEWIAPWGWTWVDDEPWGFAPFHYGRWARVGSRWAWAPGDRQRRQVYAPALVAFVGGAGWSVSASFGGGAGVGWIPLAPGEPFIPSYRSSTNYRQRINVSSGARFDPASTDVSRIQYANRAVPGAVTAVPRDAFVRSRPVAPAAVTLRPADVNSAQATSAPVAGTERLAPQRDNTRGAGVAQRAPPAAPPPPFVARGNGRSRTGEPGRGQAAPPPSAIAPPPAAMPGRGAARDRPAQPPVQPPTQPQPNLPVDRGRARPAAPPPQALPPPVTQQPPAAPPGLGDRGRGRGRGNEPPPPTQTQPPRPSGPPAGQPPPAPLPVQPPAPPPDRGRGRGSEPPPPTQTQPPRPSGPPAPQPPPVPLPPPPTAPPGQGRGRGQRPPPPQPPPVGRGQQPPPAQPPPPVGRGKGHPADSGKPHKPPPPPPPPKKPPM